ncbi:hypothetical protein L249_3954 [Ophiocordyceps polyrhachis-furcata BCC 54312]|uniref:Uncharacterized protein n=1 Tax=Ophiocordyceps polyrhachis-furcata BCC 54312 TaxID=1330021 RepID=A0A367L5M2_9HYPO|nr:hypothetical protein L249_3954 [Ophiocordyceps polyrhachis-furcata BCC 54312]
MQTTSMTQTVVTQNSDAAACSFLHAPRPVICRAWWRLDSLTLPSSAKSVEIEEQLRERQIEEEEEAEERDEKRQEPKPRQEQPANILRRVREIVLAIPNCAGGEKGSVGTKRFLVRHVPPPRRAERRRPEPASESKSSISGSCRLDEWGASHLDAPSLGSAKREPGLAEDAPMPSLVAVLPPSSHRCRRLADDVGRDHLDVTAAISIARTVPSI